MRIFNIFKNQYFWLISIIFFGFVVRLYKIDSPIADWHSWRQADTAAVTRNFIKMGFNPFLPKYDDMSGVAENPLPNPARFRFVEFPIYNIFVYPFYLLFGIDDKFHRLVSVLFSLGSIALLFFIVKRNIDSLTAYICAFCFAFLPFNVFFSRTTLPDPTFVFFALGMMYFTQSWIEKEDVLTSILSFLFMTIAFLMKPWAIFFYLPLLYLAFVNRSKIKFFKKFVVFSILALMPFILWRLWILQQPQGIPASNWLLNGDGIRFRPAFWWWIISQRIGGEILGVSGLVLFSIGLILRPKNGNYFLHLFALSSFLFITIFATGNVRHNYYQIMFIPTASIFLAVGFLQLFKKENIFLPRILTIPFALLFFILSFYFSFKQVKEFYNINNPVIIEAGKKADQILPKNAVVVAPYNGDTAFLYQTNRPGFSVVSVPLKYLVSDYGVTNYISTTRDNKTNWVIKHFEILEDNSHFVIADLTKIKKPFEINDPEP